MDKFLGQLPENVAWIAAEQHRHASTLNKIKIHNAIENNLYPELKMLEVRAAPVASQCALLQMAEHRQKMKIVLLELLILHFIRKDSLVTARVTNERRTRLTWHQKDCGIFFYFHKDLGGLDKDITCHVYVFNPSTFLNWILQPVYFAQ